MSYILAAILWLAPHLGFHTANNYAKWIMVESTKRKVDPLLMIAIVHVETAKSWNIVSRSVTRDYGLMQVHVSETTNPHLIGSEEILFNPKVNFNYGARALSMWKNYHEKKCKGDHPFWAHYAWGYVVKNLKWTIKLSNTYLCLLKRFRLTNTKNNSAKILLTEWLKRNTKVTATCSYLPRLLQQRRLTNECELSQRELKRLSNAQILTANASENRIDYVRVLNQ